MAPQEGFRQTRHHVATPTPHRVVGLLGRNRPRTTVRGLRTFKGSLPLRNRDSDVDSPRGFPTRIRRLIVSNASCTSEPDEDLAERFAGEAGPVFDALSRRARHLSRCDAEAEDLLQDALLDAYAG